MSEIDMSMSLSVDHRNAGLSLSWDGKNYLLKRKDQPPVVFDADVSVKKIRQAAALELNLMMSGIEFCEVK